MLTEKFLGQVLGQLADFQHAHSCRMLIQAIRQKGILLFSQLDRFQRIAAIALDMQQDIQISLWLMHRRHTKAPHLPGYSELFVQIANLSAFHP